jgi:hypothetical protein
MKMKNGIRFALVVPQGTALAIVVGVVACGGNVQTEKTNATGDASGGRDASGGTETAHSGAQNSSAASPGTSTSNPVSSSSPALSSSTALFSSSTTLTTGATSTDAGVDAGHAFIDAGGTPCEIYNNTCVMCSDGDWHCGSMTLEPCPTGTEAGSSCAPPNEPTTAAGCLMCNPDGSAVQFKCGDQTWQPPPLPIPMTCTK